MGLEHEGIEISQETIGSIDVRKDENRRALLNHILTEKIERVYYLTANYKKGQNYFDDYHLIDVGLVIELSNDKWLNWIWIEEGYSGECEYNISMSNILGEFRKMFYKKEDVSSSIEWSDLIGKVITDVKFQFVEQEEKTYLSELEFKITDRKIRIGSIREPEKDQKLDIEHLEFSTEWSIIVFSDIGKTSF